MTDSWPKHDALAAAERRRMLGELAEIRTLLADVLGEVRALSVSLSAATPHLTDTSLLTCKQLAEIFGTSEGFWRERVLSRQISYQKLGDLKRSPVRIRWADAVALMNRVEARVDV